MWAQIFTRHFRSLSDFSALFSLCGVDLNSYGVVYGDLARISAIIPHTLHKHAQAM